MWDMQILVDQLVGTEIVDVLKTVLATLIGISEMKYFYVLGRAPVPRPVLVSSYLEFRQSKRREMLRPLRSTGR